MAVRAGAAQARRNEQEERVMTPQLIELFAVLGCTLFTGAAIYISAVEHPARLSCGTEVAVTQWAPSYKRATVMQVPLALVGGLCGIVRWVQGGGSLWGWAALLLLAVIPFTLIVIRPTNHQLLDARRDRGSDETRRLLEKWGRLHGVRSALSLMASVLFVWAATD
jgi:4-hydroxybenzoate polyprenyltransferase